MLPGHDAHTAGGGEKAGCGDGGKNLGNGHKRAMT